MENYITVDIEWEPESNGSMILQLGATKLENNVVTGTFFSFIKPDGEIPNVERLDFMPVEMDDILNGENQDSVLQRFKGWCGENPSFIIWGSYNLVVFKSFLSEYLPISHNNTMDLQLTYSIYLKTDVMSIEKACRLLGIETILPAWHNSLYDCEQLAKLYQYIRDKCNLEAMMEQYSLEREARRREKRRKKRAKLKKQSRAVHKIKDIKHHCQYFIISETGMLHKNGCGELSDINIDDVQGFKTLEHALKGSKQTCRLCFKGAINIHPALTSRQLLKLIELHAICDELNMKSVNHSKTMVINTQVGSWYFEIDTGRRPILYHRNYIYEERNLHGALSGYHRQTVRLISDKEAVLYIYKHDKAILKGFRKNITKRSNENSNK
jgi:DNA polymerase III epsilon subunit-like protein